VLLDFGIQCIHYAFLLRVFGELGNWGNDNQLITSADQFFGQFLQLDIFSRLPRYQTGKLQEK
jgi:hypothetical protein